MLENRSFHTYISVLSFLFITKYMRVVLQSKEVVFCFWESREHVNIRNKVLEWAALPGGFPTLQWRAMEGAYLGTWYPIWKQEARDLDRRGLSFLWQPTHKRYLGFPPEQNPFQDPRCQRLKDHCISSFLIAVIKTPQPRQLTEGKGCLAYSSKQVRVCLLVRKRKRKRKSDGTGQMWWQELDTKEPHFEHEAWSRKPSDINARFWTLETHPQWHTFPPARPPSKIPHRVPPTGKCTSVQLHDSMWDIFIETRTVFTDIFIQKYHRRA